ncbi:hypothetical protein [Nocardiopsis tropica]|uniref:Uncharacterized protein n=1 Tax=Nocardiopsis tropica TaxID=109330 RepID=A0ABU7L2F7_9ACTN|nr:hypothetical protein [Nocardiopsis umidischolae]MEE2055750.1 hypothetical protein [Nocardiopsis umidischolae]
MADDIASAARRLEGRRVTVTTVLASEPYPITGCLGHVHEDAYLDLLDVPDRDRSTVRLQLSAIATIATAQ